MNRLVIYIHGKDGNAIEAEHYKPLFNNSTVIGFDYKSQTPQEAKKEHTSNRCSKTKHLPFHLLPYLFFNILNSTFS